MHSESQPRKIYWDSCVFISLMQKEKGRFEILEEIWGELESGESIIYTSAVTYLEIVKDSEGESPLAGQELQTVLAMLEQVVTVSSLMMLHI